MRCFIRSVGLLLVLAFAFCALPLGEAAGARDSARPISAEIVWGKGLVADPGRTGDVLVTLGNGHPELWTRKGGCVLPRVSRSGLVGWTHGTGVNRTQGLMNGTLVIARENKVLARITSGDSFIDLWDFADRDSCVIIHSGGPHGPRHLEKFQIKSGHLVGACLESDREARPDWATRFLEKAYREGAYVE